MEDDKEDLTLVGKKQMLRNIKYFILDMDGTFYLGDKLLDGSLEFIDTLEKTGHDFLFFTNNSSKNPDVYIDRLKGMGCTVENNKVVTSGMVTIHHLKKHHKGARVYLLGTPELEEQFINEGIELVDSNPDLVVAGFDTTITYDKLSRACTSIRQGATFIATHPDFNCPTEDGFIPDCGAICAFITASTGVKPKYLGKPYTETLEFILDHLNCTADDIAFVGDRLYTDIAIGVNHGVTGILVMTGEATEEDIKKSEIQPDIIVERLVDITKWL
ncbi:MAG TPA: HAD-IIA family hydrolase [Clostridia bacterium]|nr:HAD-IIA family hydrolase [Clostridia bacterium]